MKRAWKYTLAAVGIPLLCFGGLALEQGREPKNLAGLVPDYLPRVPLSPVDGSPYKFEDGTLFDYGRTAFWHSTPK